jgi:threonylcarbamoyladenosine tRNA methylthiotransferase MtaB
MPQKTRISIGTLGCKLNQAESEALSRQFVSIGCQIVGTNDETDVYILNTCTVTHIADRKSRKLLRMARLRNPHAIIIAIGCYVNRSSAELEAVEGIDLLLSKANTLRLIDIVSGRIDFKSDTAVYEQSSRTRAFIKAQDGCNRCCTYCIVPLVRGRENSLPADEVISEIDARVSEGYKEIVITGTEIGSYSSHGLDISGLLKRILFETKIERLRVSSLQPYEITRKLLSLWTQEHRICPHFHVSLQSGADSVLKRMKRGYSAQDYEDAMVMIRGALPEAAITTDVIVGFPGETDMEFQDTMSFCRKIGFARIHVFSYSARPGTVAATMPDQVDARTKKERSSQITALAKKSTAEFVSRHIGMTLDVLWEQQSKAGLWRGYTSNYIRVYSRNERNQANILGQTKLMNIYKDGIWGELNNLGELK